MCPGRQSSGFYRRFLGPFSHYVLINRASKELALYQVIYPINTGGGGGGGGGVFHVKQIQCLRTPNGKRHYLQTWSFSQIDIQSILNVIK